MNIFYLHEDPIQNAKWHIDKHIVKMPIEYAQLMSTAHRMLDGEMYIDRTANNHKIKRWRLNDERESVLYKPSILLIRPPKNIPKIKGTQLPQCMPEMCKVKDNPILAYRNYYIVEKNSFASWKNREIPEWYQTKDIMNTWAGG